MQTMEQIIINRGDIEKIYRSDKGIILWRALRIGERPFNPLYPDLDPRRLENGDIREPDIEPFLDPTTGQRKVKPEEGKGTSLADKPGLVGTKKWEYIAIPKGTHIPKELVITRDHFIPSKKCWHYSISPNEVMTVEAFLDALDRLAIAAKLILLGRRHG